MDTLFVRLCFTFRNTDEILDDHFLQTEFRNSGASWGVGMVWGHGSAASCDHVGWWFVEVSGFYWPVVLRMVSLFVSLCSTPRNTDEILGRSLYFRQNSET
jgi:hypothetical protein